MRILLVEDDLMLGEAMQYALRQHKLAADWLKLGKEAINACKSEIFDEYCKWLFDILLELEKQVDLTKLNEYQQRLYGFLSERLLNVWVIKNKLKVKNLPVINTEMNLGERMLLVLRRIKHKYFERGM